MPLMRSRLQVRNTASTKFKAARWSIKAKSALMGWSSVTSTSTWKEYINGRNTGTFTIKWTRQYIKGTFVNSQGKKYNVSAERTEDNWADIGDSPFSN